VESFGLDACLGIGTSEKSNEPSATLKGGEFLD